MELPGTSILLLLLGYISCLFVNADDAHVRTDSSPSFKIDPVKKQFLLDGDPFQFISGEIHYFRIPHGKWDDRLKRVRAMGLNAVQIPIPWNFHQIEEESPRAFTGNYDLAKFIKTAYNNDLYSILRIGPYIDADWDNGGLPWWLLRRKVGLHRSSDPIFTAEVQTWFLHLLPKIYPLLRKNGGPVLMIQIEHQYGAYGACDDNYMMFLRDLVREHLGNDVVLYTTDAPAVNNLRCGTVNGTLATIETLPTSDSQKINNWFNLQRTFAPDGPLVSSQYSIGKHSIWGAPVAEKYNEDDIVAGARASFQLGASISFHMIHGGTTFGFWGGAFSEQPVLTSNDYSAPISEGGDTTTSYLAIRNWISKIPNWKNSPTAIPANLARTAYPDVKLSYMNSLLGFIVGTIPECWKSSETPRTFEYIRNGFGYAMYNTTIADCGLLTIPNFADDAYVFLNDDFLGALYKNQRNIHNNTIDVQGCFGVQNSLVIIVECTGRNSEGPVEASRGLLSNLYMHNVTLQDWESCQVPIETYGTNRISDFEVFLKNKPIDNNDPATQPAVYIGDFHVKGDPADTFIDMRGWGRGAVAINQYNIGRYWSTEGPQQSLFIPSEFIKKGSNLVIIYEFQGSQACTSTYCAAKFSKLPIFN